jgi:hypothetical protein
MTWDDLLERLSSSGLDPIEEVYVDNYGNTLPLEHPKFRGRVLRCARGIMECDGVRIEAYIFPSESQLEDFLEVLGEDPLWVREQNVVFHFRESDSGLIGGIVKAAKHTENTD